MPVLELVVCRLGCTSYCFLFAISPKVLRSFAHCDSSVSVTRNFDACMPIFTLVIDFVSGLSLSGMYSSWLKKKI